MTMKVSRRRFLAISAAAIAMPAAANGAGANWNGVALGAPATMHLEGVSPEHAQGVFDDMEAELSRLEGIFSLYRHDSALAQLNRTGRLDTPPAELLEVLGLSATLHHASGGAFDPTVQAVWQAHASVPPQGGALDPDRLARALEHTGWHHVCFGSQRVHFTRPGMAITLNGIAQGYITDRISGLLASRGFGNTIVDMGEVRARGEKEDGRAWVAGIADTDGTILGRVTLTDRALATSAPLGTVLGANNSIGHIIDPRSGMPANGCKLASVSAENAALADGLSTACCLLAPQFATELVERFPDTNLETLI